MKTKDALSGDMRLLDNLIFESTPDITQAKKALRKADAALRPPYELKSKNYRSLCNERGILFLARIYF